MVPGHGVRAGRQALSLSWRERAERFGFDGRMRGGSASRGGQAPPPGEQET
jgi:hypothetical protein